MERESKLTHQPASRYDRGGGSNMSETGGGTDLKVRQEEARRRWSPVLGQEKDQDTRSTIQGMINAGILPPEGLSREERTELFRAKTKEEVDAEFAATAERLRPTEGDERRPFEVIVDKMVEDFLGDTEVLQGKSQAPGEVLKWEMEKKPKGIGDETDEQKINRIKTDWSDLNGWSTQKIKEAALDLRSRLSLNYDQIKITLEILVGMLGLSPEDLTREAIEERMAAATQAAGGQKDKRNASSPSAVYLQGLGVRPDYIQHLILTEEYDDYNKQEFDNYPDNAEDFAWQIMFDYAGEKKWGVNDKFPLLEMRNVTKKDERGNDVIDPEKSRYYINESHMTRWIRERMMVAYGLDPDVAQNYFETINLRKRFSNISLMGMFQNQARFFHSEDGKTEYGELGNQWIKEAWALQTLRSWDAAYMKERGSGEEIMKIYTAIFGENTLFKASFKKNLFSLMTSLSLDFESSKPGELYQSDNLLGAAWNDIYLAYDSMSDYDSLQKILGSGSSFFTRNGFLEAFKSGVLRGKIEVSGEKTPRAILDDEEHANFEKAFDSNGEVRNKKAFIELINIYSKKLINPNIQFMVRDMLRAAVAEKYGGGRLESGETFLQTKEMEEDTTTLEMAEVLAWSLVRVMGGEARNDTKGRAHSYLSKLFNTRIWRRKTVDRGDAFGNEQTIEQFKAVAVDPMRGILTLSEAPLVDENNEPKVDKKTGRKIMQRKPVIQVMQELNQLDTTAYARLRVLRKEYSEADAKGDEPGKESKKVEIDETLKGVSLRHQNKSGELEFDQVALQNYREDHLSMGHDLFNLIKEGVEVEWEKFTRPDVFGGVHFKTAEFQKAVQETIIHKIRYLLDTYPDLNFNMKVRTLDQAATQAKGEPVHREMTIAEMMFGHGILNRAEFWARDSKGKPIRVYDNKGKRIKGVFEIDYDKVNEDPQLIWKQWFMTKIAADLLRHRQLYSHDERYNFTYYQNAVNALIKIPGKIMSDEYGIQRVIETEPFFSKADIAWLRREAKVETFDLYWKAGVADLLKPKDPEEGIGLFLGLSLLVRQIVKQGS